MDFHRLCQWPNYWTWNNYYLVILNSWKNSANNILWGKQGSSAANCWKKLSAAVWSMTLIVGEITGPSQHYWDGHTENKIFRAKTVSFANLWGHNLKYGRRKSALSLGYDQNFSTFNSHVFFLQSTHQNNLYQGIYSPFLYIYSHFTDINSTGKYIINFY